MKGADLVANSLKKLVIIAVATYKLLKFPNTHGNWPSTRSFYFKRINRNYLLVAYCTLRIFTTQVSYKTKLTKGHQS